jgi:hypothetical protein
MTTEQKIRRAADIIREEMARHGQPVTAWTALHLARRMHTLWTERIEVTGLEPGEIAQRFRGRYQQQGD